MSNDGGSVPAERGRGEAGWGQYTAPGGGFRKGAFGLRCEIGFLVAHGALV